MDINVASSSKRDSILEAKEQDFESSSEEFSIDTECQAGVREAPVIQNQLESVSSSVDSQLEINDAINELNIEFKTTSNQFFGKIGKAIQSYSK